MSTSVLVAVLITDTVLLPVLATYSRVPLIANALGEEPTPMFVEKMLGLASISLLVVVSITDTVLLPRVGHIQPGAADRQRAGRGTHPNVHGEDVAGVGVDPFVGGGVDHRHRVAAAVGHIQPGAADRQRAGRGTHPNVHGAAAGVGVDPL